MRLYPRQKRVWWAFTAQAWAFSVMSFGIRAGQISWEAPVEEFKVWIRNDLDQRKGLYRFISKYAAREFDSCDVLFQKDRIIMGEGVIQGGFQALGVPDDGDPDTGAGIGGFDHQRHSELIHPSLGIP